MRQRLNRKNERKRAVNCCSAFLVIGAISLLSACTSANGQSSAIKPGTVYSVGFDGNSIVSYDAGNSYSVDQEGHLSISYRNGSVTAKAPVKLDTTGKVIGMSKDETGLYLSEDKTAIVYGFADGASKPLHVLITNNEGEKWNEYEIQGAKGFETKFIGFTTDKEGWIVSGASHGVGSALNYLYQTSDGGKTWAEIGNANDVYAEQLTAAGFSTKEIGFLGFRFYEDYGPVIYWTKDQGKSWERLSVTLPEKFDEFRMNPLSPTFNGKDGLFPIAVRDQELNDIGTLYLTSKDNGLTWVYDASLDKFKMLDH
ncbi:WD40/YVTN/BNR-like repeat-containing protein [Cohnella herbarum]|uniref:Sortilin N-terminal domain-containing protein n=1 Tax=Cohnella herbarum TaxID=2728023 RepID=A0A7Z2ZLF3_9BACL|nr:hypothetical protein [Cohnella herbarum]QJD84231.1 hypothetical protein HH215_14225 [Cohnella herbarum]